MKPKSSTESVLHYPRLEIAVVEKFIREHDGQFTKQAVWEQLLEKINRQTFDVIMGFLLDRQKIAANRDGKIRLTPNPELATTRGADNVASEKAPPRRNPQTKNPWSKREEANAITCFAFRNGFIEELHAVRPAGRP